MTRIAVVAGEASGDMLAAHLITALRERLPEAQFLGVAGPQMQRAGCTVWYASEMLAVRGYVEVLRHYRRISAMRRELLQRLLQQPPDLFIGVDAPDFNLWLERRLKDAGVRTLHHVSPSVWAWRRGRIPAIARATHHLLTLFPFEAPLYKDSGVDVTYVGHPLADMLPLQVDKAAARRRLNLSEDCAPVVALLPGSRLSELQYMAATFIDVADLLRRRHEKAIFLAPMATQAGRDLFSAELQRRKGERLPLRLLFGHARDALAACDVALVASGTATLEAALLKAPMVITYRMSPWTWRIMKGMNYLPWVGLPNILAGEFLVPELLQDKAQPLALANALDDLLADEARRQRITERFGDMHRQLRQGAADKAAAVVLSMLGCKA